MGRTETTRWISAFRFSFWSEVMRLVGWFVFRSHCTLGIPSCNPWIESPPALGRSIRGSFWRLVAVLPHPPKLCRLLPNAPPFPSTRPVPSLERTWVWCRRCDRSDFCVPILCRGLRRVRAPACGKDQQARVCLLLAGCLFLGCSWFGCFVAGSVPVRACHIPSAPAEHPSAFPVIQPVERVG